MAGPNTPPPIEANDNLTSTDREDSLVKKYIASKLSNKNDRLKFIKSIKGRSTTPEFIISELNVFKKQTWNERFKDLDFTTEGVRMEEIQREIGWFLTEIHTKKISLRSTFIQEYDITPDEYNKNINSDIESIDSEPFLDDLQDSDQARDNFLEKIYGSKTPKRRFVSNILKDFKIEERYDKLEPHLQQGFYDTMKKFQRRESLERADIMVLFESNILTVSEKQQIIETFMPSISLGDAKALGLIDIKTGEELKKEALEKALGGGVFWTTDLEKYLGDVDDKNLIISTKWLLKNSQSQEKLFEQNLFFDKFKDSFDTFLQKIEEDLAELSIQTAWGMQDLLSGSTNVLWIDNFREGWTIVIKQSQKNASWEEQIVTLYAEIISLASAGTFIIKERWVDRYDTSLNKNSRQTYSQFIDFVTKGDVPESVEFISPETLKHRLQTWDIPDVNGNGTFHNRTMIDEDVKDLTKRIEARKKELQDKGYTKEERHKDEELQKLYRERSEKSHFRDTLEENNKKTLAAEIDELDTEWKDFWIDKWVSFVTEDGKGDVFSITDIDEVNQVVTVRWLKDNEPVSYIDFIEAFKQQKAKRVSKIDRFEELFSKGDDMGWFKFSDGKVKKEWSKKEVPYDYLVPPAGSDDELLKIHSINDTMVTVSFWKVKDQKKLDKTQWKEVKTGEVFNVEKQEYRISIGVLDHYIKQNKLWFRSLQEWKVREEEMEGIPKPETKFGFGNWFFQWMSLAAAMKWWKVGIEQITNMLNEWDEDKANQFALKMFGAFIWEDGRTDMRSRVEQTQKKNMDEMIERLKGINSAPATKLIRSWLQDPRTPHYKQEAGLFYMMQKYGALCCKDLYDLQGTYFWYQQLWGRIWDSNWLEVHAENNREPRQNTTEEFLVYRLMKKQTRAGGYNGIQRRSKLDKELKAIRGQWKEEEWETGNKDGRAERDIKDRLDGGLWEMSSWNYPNAMWWLETIVEKWGTMKQMNMIPFVMMFSGMAYHFEKDLVDKIKNLPSESKLLMMVRFMSYTGDIDLVNDTIVEICRNLERKWGKYKWIRDKAESIRANSRSRWLKDLDKQKDTIAFYEEYGDDITKILYMLNTGDKDDVDNKMIFFEKDTNVTFRNYYEKMEGFTNASETDYGKDEAIMSDALAQQGTSGLNMYKAAKQLLELRTWWSWAKHDAGPEMWKEIVHEMEAIPKRIYDKDPEKNKKMQRKLLDHNIRYFIAAITSLNTDTRFLSSYNAPTWPFNRLNDWGMYLDKVIDEWANADALKSWGHKELIDGFVDGVMKFATGWWSSKIPTRSLWEWKWEYIDEKDASNLTVSGLIDGTAEKVSNEIPKPVNDNLDPDEGF